MTQGDGGGPEIKIEIPTESFRAFFIEMVFRGGDGLRMIAPETVLASGTGFIYRVDGNDYLITARHNFTGRHWQTNELLYTAHAVDPTHVHVRVRERPPARGYTSGTPVNVGHMSFQLVDDEFRPLWLEHPTYGPQLDVVALPIKPDEKILALPWEPQDAATEGPFSKYWVAQDVSIVGFPYGLMGGFDLPLWIRGTVASEPEIPYSIDGQNLPLFLVDARTRKGQSGSPVLLVTQPFTPIPQGDGQPFVYSPTPVSRLIGVYSGRISDESDLGFVWRIEAVEAICRHGERPK